jgi:predicted lysophospholipase L1 biosynthesis ABC-type transport system permease subunit
VLATLAAVSIGAVAALLADLGPSLGTSRLGAHAASVAGAPEAVLGAVALAGSLFVLAALLIAGVDARAGEWRTLQALGWRRRSIGLALGAELSVVLLLAVVATAVAAPLTAPVSSLSGLSVAVAVAAAPVVVAAGAIVSILDARRLVRTG